MSYELLLIPMIFTIVLLIVYLMVRLDILGKAYSDKFHCAKIFIKTSKGYELVNGWLVHQDTKGETYEYRYHKCNLTVTVGKSYPVKYYKRGRMIGAMLDNAIAIPLWEGDRLDKEPQFSPDDLSIHTMGYIVIEAINSIKGKSVLTLKTLLIILAIAAVIGLGIWYMSSQSKQPQIQPSVPAGQTTPKPTIPTAKPTIPPSTTPSPVVIPNTGITLTPTPAPVLPRSLSKPTTPQGAP